MMLQKKPLSRWRSPTRLVLFFLILLTFSGVAFQTQRRIVLDVTEPSSAKFLDHFYPSENGVRWTERRSAIWLPGLGGGNLSWRIGVTLSGSRPEMFATPAHVVVRVSGATVAEFDARNQEQDYEWEIRPWQLGLNGDLLLEIDSSTFRPSSDDEAELGVRVARIWLTRSDGIAFPPVRGFLLTLTLVGCFTALLQMSSSAGLIRIPRSALVQFIDPLRNRWAWFLVVVWLAVIVLQGCNHYEASWWLQTITFGLLLTTILIWAIARILSGSLTPEQAFALVAIFIIAALVRIPFDLGRGYEGDIASYGKQGDIATYIALTWKTVSYGIQSAYVQVSESPPSDNPPVLLYPFWFLGWLYEQLISPLFGRTHLGDPAMLRFMLRLPGLVSDLLAGALVFRALRQRESVSFKTALFATGAYLLNPALICDSAYWGQTAAVHALFMLLSVMATDRRAYGWAGVSLATAILTKPQAIAIAPLILLFASRDRGLLRLTAAGAAAALLITMPFIIAGNSADVLHQYTKVTQYHPFIAVNAHNFWWFITGGRGWLSDATAIGPITFRQAGFLLFGCATLLSLILVWRNRQMIFLIAAYQCLAFFMLNTQIHENHSLAMFAPLIIAAAFDRAAWWFYCAFMFTVLANMTLHDPRLFAWLGYPSNEIYGGPALALPRWLNAAFQTVLFAGLSLRLVTASTAGLRAESSSLEAT
ncbi:MAG TPA: hypothetical protein VLK27_07025 [Chthoniobacterales bacterium]|nr:hypothetical protein [Chthoniobacterales bacterium]